MEEIKIDYANMSIYKKIQVVKQKILDANLKKTGENKYSGFKYYELSDFVPSIIKFCNEVGLFTKFNYTNELATLTIINCDKIEEKEEYTSPMKEVTLKGCNEIQSLGGIETYSRRYLYMSAFDISEKDRFDGSYGKDKNKKTKSSEEQLKHLELHKEFMNILTKTDTDLDLILDTYKVKDSLDLSDTQLTQSIRQMSKKLEKKEVF